MFLKFFLSIIGLALMLISAPIWGVWEGTIMSWGDKVEPSMIPKVLLLSQLTCWLYFIGFLIFMPLAQQVFGENRAITLLLISAGLWEIINILFAILTSAKNFVFLDNISDFILIGFAFVLLFLAASRIEDRIL